MFVSLLVEKAVPQWMWRNSSLWVLVKTVYKGRRRDRNSLIKKNVFFNFWKYPTPDEKVRQETTLLSHRNT